jgi:hypothetical protein
MKLIPFRNFEQYFWQDFSDFSELIEWWNLRTTEEQRRYV